MKQKKVLSERIKKRRNFFFSFVLMLIFWIGLGAFIFLVSPKGIKEIAVFFVLAFGALFWFFSLLFANSRLGLILTFFLTTVLFLRMVRQLNILNIILLTFASIGIIIALKRRG